MENNHIYLIQQRAGFSDMHLVTKSGRIFWEVCQAFFEKKLKIYQKQKEKLKCYKKQR